MNQGKGMNGWEFLRSSLSMDNGEGGCPSEKCGMEPTCSTTHGGVPGVQGNPTPGYIVMSSRSSLIIL